MSKSFSSGIAKGLDNLIPTGEKPIVKKARQVAAQMKEAGKLGKVGRPKRTDKDNEVAPSAEKGTKPGDMRKTYLVAKKLDDKITTIAYWDRKTVKEVINEALSGYIASWEKKNGPADKVKSK